MSPTILQRLNVVAICALGGVLASVLVAQVLPGVRAPAQPEAAKEMNRDYVWTRLKTLQVCPSEPDDPVKLVRIVKDGKVIAPGTYRMPEASGDPSLHSNPLDDWLKDISFVLENDTSREIVSVGIAVVFPMRHTGYECSDFSGNKTAPDPWCDAHPHWCDGGCPELLHKSLHWGRLPATTAAGLEARYRNENRWVASDLPGIPLQGRDSLEFPPGSQIALTGAGRGDSLPILSSPLKGFWDSLNGMLAREGIDEAQGEEPCLYQQNSKAGCGLRELSTFNLGIVIVHFDDGTIWGNFGYGYAVPKGDGIFSRVQEGELPDGFKPTPPVN